MTSQRARRRYNSCTRKRRYNRAEHAQAAIDRAFRASGEHIGDPYPCSYCGGWHVGRHHAGDVYLMDAPREDLMACAS